MKIVIYSLLVFGFGVMSATAQDNAKPGETAKAFIRQGDYNNAVLVLNRAIENDKDNIELKKDLAFAYYLQRDYTRALSVAKPLAESKDADVQSFQLLGMVYKAIEQIKEAEKMYKAALKKYPKSGVLHNEYGEMLWSKGDFAEAANQWQKGVEIDPNYSGNYYNLAKYYYMTADKVWGLIYGEIFVNLESYSKRTPEIKTILLDGYKKLFTETDMFKNQNNKNEFTKAFLEVMKNQTRSSSSRHYP